MGSHRKSRHDAEPSEKRTLLSEALSNSTLLDRNIVEVRYQSPCNIFALAPLNPTFQEMLAGWDDVGTFMYENRPSR